MSGTNSVSGTDYCGHEREGEEPHLFTARVLSLSREFLSFCHGNVADTTAQAIVSEWMPRMLENFLQHHLMSAV